jgi:hypothetical protein
MTSHTGAKRAEQVAKADHDTGYDVFHLTSPMTLAAGTELKFTCDSAIGMILSSDHRVLISSFAPTIITAARQMIISPSGPYGARFARGPAKLPTELRLHVLRFNLVHNGLISHAFDLPNMEEALFEHLAMAPNIATLVREVFYENTFVICNPF